MALDIDRAFHPATLRKTVLDMAFSGSTGHIGSAFSIIELVAVLYRSYLRYPGNDPLAADRDYFVLSKGHGVMAQYACMREKGWVSDHEIATYYSNGSRLKGLSDSRVHGLEVTSGSLGHGFSVGVGLALAAKIKATGQRVYAVVGDGELNEGSIWEGIMFASHHDLSNLMIIVDQNRYQAMGLTQDVMRMDPLEAKFESFGLQCLAVDGHDEAAIDSSIGRLWASGCTSPKAIVAKTTKGKGVSFMENDNRWHYTKLNPSTYQKAIEALGLGGI